MESGVKNKYGIYIKIVVLLFVTLYFSYYLLKGEKGILSLLEKRKNLEKLHSDYNEVKLEKMDIEHQVQFLSDKTIDLDLIDELARKNLGFIKEGEIVVFDKEESSTKETNN